MGNEIARDRAKHLQANCANRSLDQSGSGPVVFLVLLLIVMVVPGLKSLRFRFGFLSLSALDPPHDPEADCSF